MVDVLVLGGGIGGVVMANRLRRLLPRSHRVALVEREPIVSYPPAYLRVLDGRREPQAITRDLRRLRRRGIDVVEATVTAIDVDARTVETDGGALAYDYLVVALGTQLAPETIPGLAETGHNIYTLDGNVAYRDALRRFDGGVIAVVAASLPYKCPAAPYEAALLIDTILRHRGVRNRTTLRLFAPEAAPMPVAGPMVGEQVTALLAERGIDYRPRSPLQSVDAAAQALIFADGSREQFDLLAVIPPHAPPAAVRASALANPAGWIAVDAHTLETRVPGVFAIGDVTAIPLPSGMMLPKAGVFAHAEAEAVARTIAHRVTGRGAEGRFDGHGSCFLEVGDGRAAYAAGDFYAVQPGAVRLRGPSRHWLWYKSLFERYWLWRWY